MKKIVSLILAAAMAAMMLFAFASCGKKDDDTLVCGVTLVDRINYKDENGEWVGFDSDFAKEVGKIIGMKVEFQEIQWEQKYNELSSGASGTASRQTAPITARREKSLSIFHTAICSISNA